MNVFKKITLTLTIFCFAQSAFGMDQDDVNQGFFGRIWSATKEYPVLTASVALAAGVGIWGYKQFCARQEVIQQRPMHEGLIYQLIASFGKLLGDSFFQGAILEGPTALSEYLTGRNIFMGQKEVSDESRKRIKAVLCSFKSKEFPVIMPRDVQDRIISYLPEDVLNKNHCKLLYNHGVSMKQLIAHCPFEWFKQLYQETEDTHKTELLEEFVQCCLDDLRLFLMSENTQQRVRDAEAIAPTLGIIIDSAVYTLLDPNNVEQFRDALRKNIQEAFVGEEQANQDN